MKDNGMKGIVILALIAIGCACCVIAVHSDGVKTYIALIIGIANFVAAAFVTYDWMEGK